MIPKEKLQRVLDYTDPIFIRGIIIGVVISILFALIFSTGSMLMVFYGLIAVVILLIAGAIIGNYVYNLQKKKIDDLTEEKLNQAADDFKNTTIKVVQAALNSNKEKTLPKAIKNISKSDATVEIAKLGIAAFVRFLSFTSLITVLGGLLSFALFIATYMQVKHLETQNNLITGQNKKIDIQNSLAESSRRAGIVFELTSILGEVDEELDDVEKKIVDKGYFDINSIAKSIENDLKDSNGELDFSYMLFNPNIQSFLDSFNLNISVFPEYEKYYIQPKLSRRLEGRIIAISKALRPYKYLNEDNKLSDVYLSPERGQLLISLLESDVLTSQIIPKSDFSYSDLKGFDIAKVIDFQLLKTELTDLQLITLNNSDLEDTSFDFIYFNSASFNGSHFKNTSFNRCDLDGSTVLDANINSVTFSSCNMEDTDFSNANLGVFKVKDSNLELISLKNTKIDTAVIKESWLPKFDKFAEMDSLKSNIEIAQSYTNDSLWIDSLILMERIVVDSTSFTQVPKGDIEDIKLSLVDLGVSAIAFEKPIYRVTCRIRLREKI